MTTQHIRTLLLVLALVTPALALALAQPAAWSDWRHGAAGHTLALSDAQRSEQPLVVYFHTDWCPWCRQLNDRYLRNGAVRSTLSGIKKVEINPERGPQEMALFRQYGGTGYPSFYVLVPASGEAPVRLSPFRGGSEDSLAAFAERIEAAATQHYNRWAFRLHQEGQDARSLAVVEKSLAHNPRNAYAHYLRGLIHHKAGDRQRDLGLLREAKTAYERALSLDPGHQGSQRGFEALRNL
ncbi:thioredoxin family protein [Thioalkalivibrio sulfidiphilus]|uniref:thioredoxin family protein n=1 Tax=Thioalkalivibrio sulfidiphilus TaxID=1033854 RepID=UPI003B301BF1